MILSRTLARRRIATGRRPGWLAAWVPVLVDGMAIVAVLALFWEPVMLWIYATQPGNGLTFLILFLLFFVPVQAVLILSSLWASRSRWKDDTEQK